MEPLVQLQEADSTVPDQQLPVSSTLEEEQSTSRGVKRSRSNSEEEVGILKNILSSSEILLKAKSDLGGAKEDPNSSSINEQSTTTVGDSHEEPDKTSPTTDIQGDGESVSSNENKDISTDDSECVRYILNMHAMSMVVALCSGHLLMCMGCMKRHVWMGELCMRSD